jgi:hypothetical protein
LSTSQPVPQQHTNHFYGLLPSNTFITVSHSNTISQSLKVKWGLTTAAPKDAPSLPIAKGMFLLIWISGRTVWTVSSKQKTVNIQVNDFPFDLVFYFHISINSFSLLQVILC